MAAAPVVTRHAHQRSTRLNQQSIDGGGRDGGVVHQRKEHAIGMGRNGAEAALHRGGLPARPVRVDDERGGGVPTRADPLRLGAQHHNHGRTAHGEQAGQPVEKRLLAVSQQSFRKTHAARFAGGQNQSSDNETGAHFASTVRNDSSANTDIESERQLDAAPRRTAIISAATEIAISSGETAPIFRPMGAWMRSKAARGIPSFSSSRMTFSTLRLLPIMAM